jgi:hypothetical protein
MPSAVDDSSLYIPPPPKKREFIFYDMIEKPTSFEGQAAFTIASSGMCVL